MKAALPVIAFMVLSAGVVSAQDPWQDDLREAGLSGDSSRVVQLLSERRLDIGPVVENLIEVWLGAADGPAGRSAGDSARPLDAAALISRAYTRMFDETGHERRVRFARSLSAEKAALKLEADSLYDEAFDRRGSADTREEARSLYTSAFDLYERIGDTAGMAETAGQIGYVNWWLDRDGYLTFNTRALELRRELDDQLLVGNSLNDLGLYHRVISRDFETALEYYGEAEQIRTAIGDSAALARMLPNMALSWEGLGAYEEAETYYRRAAELYLAIGDTARWITQRNNAAGLLTDYLDRHSDAYVAMLDLKADLREIHDPRAEAVVANSLGVVSRRLGDYEGAITEYQEVIRLSEEHGFDDLLASALNNIGVVFIWIERPDRAQGYFERASDVFERLDSPDGRLDALQNLGSSLYEMQRFPESATYWREAHDLATTLNDPVSLGVVNTGLGNTLLRHEGPDAAEPAYRSALDIAEEYDLPELQIGALFGLGDVMETSGRPLEALDWYERGIEVMEGSRALLHAQEDKAGHLARNRYLFEDVIDFLTDAATGDDPVRNNWNEELFRWMELSRARAFLDRLQEAITDVRSGVDPELLADQQVLTDNLVYLRQELLEAETPERRDELKALIREQELEFDRVERELVQRNPAYAELKYPRTASLSEIQEGLAPGQVLLEYSLGDSSSTLVAISSESASVHRLPVRSVIADQVEILRFALQAPDRSDVVEFSRTSSELRNVLLRPARALVEESRELIIIPDGILNYLPFEVLTRGIGDDFSTLDYLVSDRSISYAPSATIRMGLLDRKQSRPGEGLLAVGNPDFGGTNAMSALRGGELEQLPFAGREVEQIASLVGGLSTIVLTGSGATEQAVRDAVSASGYRFVHFATHGIVNENRPDYSALALARGEHPGEGLLQASEIFNLRIEADLVVLSACETGLGQLVQGEGMVGLTRAFMYAGTPSVVASLWNVADQSTADLMTAMYVQLIEQNASKAQSLAHAKRQLVATPATAHPFYWAPFILIGDSE